MIPRSFKRMMPTIHRINTSKLSPDKLDDLSDDMIESPQQRDTRLQAQLRQDKQKGTLKMTQKLIDEIRSLPEENQNKLATMLLPILQARQEYLDFATVQIPADLAEEKRILQARTPYLNKPNAESKLKALDDELNAVRKRISNHIPERVRLSKECDKVSNRFSWHF